MEGIAGSSFTGDIALDDLKMSYKYCQLSPSQARPTTPPPPPPPTPTIPRKSLNFYKLRSISKILS